MFVQTFDKLTEINAGIINTEGEYKVSSEKEEHADSEEELAANDSVYRLEQMSMIAVNNMADIFIYYVATVYQETNEQ
jgi:hypothetical protein